MVTPLIRTLCASVFICCLSVNALFSQTAYLTGVINHYASVEAFDTSLCRNQIIVDTAYQFSVGERVIIVQMKGAQIYLGNDSAFGTVLDYRNAGGYEINYIWEIRGDTIVFANMLQKEYDINAAVQILNYPVYSSAMVIDTLTAMPWDGAKGGILAFEVTGDLIFNGVIDVTGKGFRGGRHSRGSVSCNHTDYFSKYIRNMAGKKGEGIANYDILYEAGRGPLANGGGGGNNSNSGGGGGSNYGTGGRGGNQYILCGPLNVGGLGGRAIDYNNLSERIFLGGGGGGGQENDDQGTCGAPGGGAVLIKATRFLGNNKYIIADGADVDTVAGRDGAGGGGGGGSVLIYADTFMTPVTVMVNGGDGGNTNNSGYTNCHGTGAGGGGGVLWINRNHLPANITLIANGGAAGIITNPNANCGVGSTYGSTTGSPGGFAPGLLLPGMGNSPVYSCINGRPHALDDPVFVPVGYTIVIDVQANDTDPDSNPLKTRIWKHAVNGSSGVVNNDSIVYIPFPGFTGQDSIKYIICDDGLPALCDTATVYIRVDTNQLPTAVNDTFYLMVNTQAVIDVQQNDFDPNMEILRTRLVTQPQQVGLQVLNRDSIIVTPDSGFTGLITFKYSVCDAGNLCDTARVYLFISLPNYAPVAVDDSATVPKNQSSFVHVTANDIDLNGDSLSVSVYRGPYHGNAYGSGAGIVYTPFANYIGFDTLHYIVCDNGMPALCDTGLLVLNVVNNERPIAVDDSTGIWGNGTLAILPLANDRDPDRDSIYYHIISQPIAGHVSINGDTLYYTISAGFAGIDTIGYIVCDDGIPSLCDTGNVFVYVFNNIAPRAANDSFSVPGGRTEWLNVIANDYDPDGDPFVPQVTGEPSNGSSLISSPDSLAYTPDSGFSGIDTIYYTICDFGFPPLCDTAMVLIRVRGNNAPVANNDFLLVEGGTTTIIGITNNDVDPDGDTLSASIIQQPSHGQATILNDTLLAYQSSPGFTGFDTIGYLICDNHVETKCDTGWVFLQVVYNHQPVAVNDTVTLPDQIMTVIDVQRNDYDADNGQWLTTSLVTTPVHGTATVINNDSILYIPNPGFTGTETFAYEICDNSVFSKCDTALVVVNVVINQPPVAANDSGVILGNQTLLVDVQANDYDPDGNQLTTYIVNQPDYGNAVVQQGSKIFYVPDGDYTGYDVIYYRVCDDGIPSLCDTAALIIHVTGNHAPVAVNDHVVLYDYNPVTIPVQANDYDPDGHLFATFLTILPNHGTAAVSNYRDIAYTPVAGYSGFDTLWYSICDNGPFQLCASARVVIEIRVNQAPVAIDDSAVVVSNGSTVMIDILANDFDPDGDNITPALVGGPYNGSASLTTGNKLQYRAYQGFEGPDFIHYRICDDRFPSKCDTATVFLDIRGIEYFQIDAVNDAVTTEKNNAVNIHLLVNDSWSPSVTPVVSIVEAPSNGIIDFITQQVVRYQPDAGYTGADEFRYRICDLVNTQICDTANVQIEINGKEILPLKFPNTFTPDNDGDNDVLVIQGIEEHPNNMVCIFNRWGNEVYRAESYQNDWDGTYKDGKPLPDGTYYYIIEIRDLNEKFTGYITILR